MKLITRNTDYAVNALYFMALDRDKIYTVSELAKKTSIPGAFLRKILQVLNKKGIVRSFKGKGGGFKLALLPDKIFLLEIMEIFQGRFKLNECILNKKICPNKENCRLKIKIEEFENYIQSKLESITLGSLLE